MMLKNSFRFRTVRNKNQAGNVLFLILIAVALFAALSFVVMNSTRSGSGSTKGENAKLLASQILNYTVSVGAGVSRLMAQGCGISQLSFEREPFDGNDPDYSNAMSPADFSCHVFHVNGAGVPYQIPPEEAQDIPAGGGEPFREYYYSLSNQVLGLGTDDMGNFNSDSKDLMIIMPYVSRDVCMAMNQEIQREHEEPPVLLNTLDVIGFWTGDLAALGTDDIEDADGYLRGAGTACGYATSVFGPPELGQAYYFYSVIMVR